LKLLETCCGVWLRRWRRRLNKWRGSWLRLGAAARGGWRRSCLQLDILYKDKWFRIATAVFTQLKKEFAEDGKAAEVIEAAERRLYGLRLELVEVPLLKIEAAVDRDGKIAAVRCRAALDLGVEAVFKGVAPGYKLENVHVDKSAGTAVGAMRRGEEGGWVERVLEEVRREFSGLPVYVGVEDGYVYVKRTAPMDKRQFRRHLETCRRLGFRFDRRGEWWVKPLEELKTIAFSTGRAYPADHISLPHILNQPLLAQCVYRLSDGGPPHLCPRRGQCYGAAYHLYCPYLGEASAALGRA
jgi:hypothetical protein